MLQPNWFDEQHGILKTPEDFLAVVAHEPRVLQAVQQAFAEFDANPSPTKPSRSQTFRRALCAILSD